MRRVVDLWFPDADQHMADEYRGGRTQLDRMDAAFEFVDDWQCAVDGGAFVGWMSLRLAERFASVLAFEPSADTYDCLVRNVRGVDAIRCWPNALGERRKTAGIAVDSRHLANMGGRYLTEDGDIDVLRLDDFELPSLGLIKLDVEGYELFALQGAERTLKRCRPVVVFEDKERLQMRQGVPSGKVSEYLVSLGARQVREVGSDRIFAFR